VSAALLRSAEAPTTQDQQLAALVKEVQTQQAQLAENQAAIDAKLATIGEALRMARIYISRGGH
jgi:hypothetical protein